MGKGLDFRVDVVKELLLALDVQVLCLFVWTVIVGDCALPMGEDSRRMGIGVRWGVRTYHPCELAPVSSLPSLAGPKACCGSCFCLIHQLPTSAGFAPSYLAAVMSEFAGTFARQAWLHAPHCWATNFLLQKLALLLCPFRRNQQGSYLGRLGLLQTDYMEALFVAVLPAAGLL